MPKRRPQDEDEEFLRAMQQLGLAEPGARNSGEDDLDFDALMREATGEAPPRRALAPTVTARPADSVDRELAREDALFAEAMAALAGANEPTGEAEQAAAPPKARRRARAHGSKRTLARQIKGGRVVEERSLDLHGKSRERAWSELERFLRRARADELDVVKVITGRGLHSIGDAVLMKAVGEWLDKGLRGHVREVVKAPPDRGGEGVRFVFLRPPSDA
ncbi:MAG: hypothetical protein CSA24_01900 [Deltaproteobacteria bacterium]|nr:MAG: hypothetical protein CSA24_01900 [Deltaproteobacteria bacterium]